MRWSAYNNIYIKLRKRTYFADCKVTLECDVIILSHNIMLLGRVCATYQNAPVHQLQCIYYDSTDIAIIEAHTPIIYYYIIISYKRFKN